MWAIAGLSFVLYLGYASFFVLHTFCILCLTTYVAVIGIFLLSGSASEIDMRSLPARVLRDLRALATSPAALTATLVVLAGAASLVAFFPRQAETPLSSTAAATAAPAALAGDQQTEFERWYTTPAAHADGRGHRRREGRHHQVQRLHVPAVPADLGGVQAGPREVAGARTRAW